MADHEIFDAGDFVLQSGETLPGCRLAYVTRGEPDGDGSNAVLVFTHFGARHGDCQYLVGENMALDPRKYFIVVLNLMGNGVSSSPSNAAPPCDGPRFPVVTILDNVRLQHVLVTQRLGIRRIRLAVGHSMGAQQAYHWGALYPDLVERIAPICGSARTSVHNACFLEGMRGVLTADPAWRGGDYEESPAAGLRAMARAWAPWPPSQWFYREEGYRALGHESLDAFLVDYWERWALSLDANDILSQISTWLRSDIGDNDLYRGNFEAALAAIEARAIVMPGRTDTYFPPEDSEYEVAHMPDAELRPIPSTWGHWAGSGRRSEDTAFIDRALRDLLAR